MTYTTIFFDLDDTLYPASSGLWREIRRRMGLYMVERLGLPADQVDAIRQHYFQTYGTTLRGLQQFYPVNTDDYLAFVHDLPLASYLQPAPALRPLLLGLPQQRWILTNADQAHAERVLKTLQLCDCFAGIIDVRRLNFFNKPDPNAYRLALDLVGSPAPQECIMLDDSAANLAPANQLGMTTVWVNQEHLTSALFLNARSPHYEIEQLNELRQVLPRLGQAQAAAELRKVC